MRIRFGRKPALTDPERLRKWLKCIRMRTAPVRADRARLLVILSKTAYERSRHLDANAGGDAATDACV
jgi:hypothetical protein